MALIDQPVGPIAVGIPVFNEFNRANALYAGWPSQGRPWPSYYQDSVQIECHSCGGGMWIAPTQKRRLALLALSGAPSPALCLICLSILKHLLNADVRRVDSSR
jgi:hypothetical protein